MKSKSINIKRTRDRLIGFSMLYNLGNTCYINSVIQCLVNENNFMELLIKNRTEVSNKFLEKFIDVLTLMKSDNYKIMMSSFYELFLEEFINYKKNTQYDVKEFLFELIDKIHDNFKKKGVCIITKENSTLNKALIIKRAFFDNKMSFISSIFYGQYKNTRTCLICNKDSYNFDVFLNISVYPTSSKNLQDLIDDQFKYSTDTIDCSFCKKRTKHILNQKILELPSTLIIVNNIPKPSVPFDIPEVLSMDKYSTSDSNNIYNLSSILFHNGTFIDNGHFYTVSLRNSRYYLFNDEKMIKDIDITQIDDTRYIIFYTKKI